MASIFTSRREAELEEQLNILQGKLENLKSVKAELADTKEKLYQRETSYNNLSEKHNRLRDAYTDLKERYRKLTESAEGQKPESPDHTPIPRPPKETTGNDHTPQQESTPTSANSLEPIIKKLGEVAELQKVLNSKDEIIKQLHNELLKLQDDIFAKIGKPYLNAIIRIHAHMAGVIEQIRSGISEDTIADNEAIAKSMESTLIMMQDLLEDEFEAAIFAPKPGDTYEPRIHHAVKSIPTSDPEIGGTIADCIQKGFRRTDDGKVIKQAVVTVYRLDNK